MTPGTDSSNDREPGPFILVSDLDDTLLGDDGALARFAEYHEKNSFHLIYASGRFCRSIQQSIDETLLPEPVATIGGVGSEIWRYPERLPDLEWWQRISSDWSAQAVREILDKEPDLVLQPEEDQSDFKVSYYLEDADEARLRGLKSRVEEGGIRARMIYSSNRDLDFLPNDADKGCAAEFITGILGYPKESILAAGNSANDSSLMEHGFRGIIVGNAHGELRKLARKRFIYQADRTYADGVIEGVEHWTGIVSGS